MKQTISFKLFGGLRVLSADRQWKPIGESVHSNIGKKQQAFLIYLLLNHSRRITSAELIEHFWPGDSKDPANSLKNMMHKTRVLLREIFPDIQDLIVTQSGNYEWSSEAEFDIDIDTFERLYQDAKKQGTAEGTELKLRVFELYTGDILPGISTDWLDHLNTYYRTVYIDICKSLAVQLLDERRWDDVIHICSQAYTLAPEIEEFTVCAIHAMVNSGLPGQAIKHYETYRAMLWDEFSLVPSAAVEQAYTLAVYAAKSTEDYEEKIIQQLASPPEQHEAFHCGLLVFQNIVQLELRHMARSGHPSSIAILHTETTNATEPSSTDIRRLERVLLQSLRAGDPFTRLNMGSFALLLPSATPENSEKVMERIKASFHSTYPRSRAVLRYSIYPLKPEQAP